MAQDLETSEDMTAQHSGSVLHDAASSATGQSEQLKHRDQHPQRGRNGFHNGSTDAQATVSGKSIEAIAATRTAYTRFEVTSSSPNRIKTLIVSGKPLVRRQLVSLLALETDFECVGEHNDCHSAARAISSVKPDILLVDAQSVPARATIAILSKMDYPSGYVFINVPNVFDIGSQESRVVDCLPNPFDLSNFVAALKKVRAWFRTDEQSGNPRDPLGMSEDTGRVLIKCGARLVSVRLQELEFVRASGNYVHLQVGDQSFEAREKIGALHTQLPANRFVRIHRSYIANLNAICEFYPIGRGEYMIGLRSGRQLPAGSSYSQPIRQALARSAKLKIGLT